MSPDNSSDGVCGDDNVVCELSCNSGAYSAYSAYDGMDGESDGMNGVDGDGVDGDGGGDGVDGDGGGVDSNSCQLSCNNRSDDNRGSGDRPWLWWSVQLLLWLRYWRSRQLMNCPLLLLLTISMGRPSILTNSFI